MNIQPALIKTLFIPTIATFCSTLISRYDWPEGFHDAPISPFKIFLQGKLLFYIVRNPEYIIILLTN